MDYPLENKRAEVSFIKIVFTFEEVNGVGWQSLGHVYIMTASWRGGYQILRSFGIQVIQLPGIVSKGNLL